MAYKKFKKDGTPAQKPGRKRIHAEKPKTGPAKGPRPHVWVVGPDEFKHSMYHPWQMSKAQAVFRNEEWNLSFDEYYNIWKDYWHNRGKKVYEYCQSREDPEGAWDKDNMVIITRREHLLRQAATRAAGKMKYRAPPGRPKKPIEYAKRRR